MDQRRARSQRPLEVPSRLEDIHVEDDVIECVLGDVATRRHDHRHRLTHMADLVLRERNLGCQVEHETGNRGRRNEQGPRLPIVAEVGRRVDGEDPLATEGRGHIDGGDAGVRVRTAEKGDVEHPLELDVVDEQGPAGQKPRVLISPDRGADAHEGVR
jgi:hypothetical protein